MSAPVRNSNLFDQGITAGVVALVVLASALAMSPSVADPDLWGHVQFGRDVLQTGQIAPTTSYSFTAEGFRWINHENLSEIVLAWTVDQYGNQGLLYGKFLLSLFVIAAIIIFNLRRGVGLVAASVLTLLVAWNLGYHWSFRPQVSSFILFTWMILVLQFCFSNWRDQWHMPLSNYFGGKSNDSPSRDSTSNPSGSELSQSWLQGRLLWVLFPIVVIWTNSHGGFVAGVCIAIAYLVLRAFEAWWVFGRDGLGLVRRMALIAVAIGLATLLNPYSYRLPFWLFESLGAPRVEISDWSNAQLGTMVGVKFWCLLGIAAFALALSRKSHDLVQTTILGITLWQSLSHFRHVPFFTLLCGFWLGPHLHSALNRIQGRAENHLSKISIVGLRQQLIAASLMLLLIGGVCFRLQDRLSQIKVDRSVYPVDAFAYLNEHDINGKLVVTYNWAQFAIASMCVPETDNAKSRVAFDGRFRTCYPQEIVDMHFDFLYGNEHLPHRFRSVGSGEINPAAVLQFGNPDLALVRCKGEIATDVLRQNSDWVLIYRDGLAEVWGHRARFDDPQSPDFLPASERRIGDEMPTGFVSWPAMNPARRQEIETDKVAYTEVNLNRDPQSQNRVSVK